MNIIQSYPEPLVIASLMKRVLLLSDEDWVTIWGSDENFNSSIAAQILEYDGTDQMPHDNLAKIMSKIYGTADEPEWTAKTELTGFGRSFLNKSDAADMPIKQGVSIAIPPDIAEKINPIFDNKILVSPFKEFKPILNKEQERLMNDENYIPLFDKNGIRLQFVKAEVFLISGMRGVYDLSKYVTAINTGVTENGGTFNVELADATTERTLYSATFETEAPTKEYIDQEIPNNVTESTEKGQIRQSSQVGNTYIDNLFITDGKGEQTLSPRFFHSIIQKNDVIVIKFHDLEFDKKNIANTLGALWEEYPWDNLFKGDALDMIGLVDNTNLNISATRSSTKVAINGRDLSKVLHDDISVYYPTAGDFNIGDSDYQSLFFLNSEAVKNSEVFQRLYSRVRIAGEDQDINVHRINTIGNWLNYIFTKLNKVRFSLLNSFGENEELNLDGQGVWRLIKLHIDPQISHISAVDSSIAMGKGPMYDFIQKVIQKPFLEFYGDTVGDKYYFTARRPPFAKDAFLGNVRTNIENVTILNLNLTYDTRCYSWYKLKPYLWYQGDTNFPDYYFAAVFFPQLADLWGAKPLEVTSQYIDYGVSSNTNEYGFSQAYNDLRWLIESNVHLPFTRKGTIRMTGDRRIKRGSCVYLKATDELFYVDEVRNKMSHSIGNVKRETILTVSRGIVLSHADKYFNLVNFGGFDPNQRNNGQVSSEDVEFNSNGEVPPENDPKIKDKIPREVRNWNVDLDLLSFFLNGKQFFDKVPDRYDDSMIYHNMTAKDYIRE